MRHVSRDDRWARIANDSTVLSPRARLVHWRALREIPPTEGRVRRYETTSSTYARLVIPIPWRLVPWLARWF